MHDPMTVAFGLKWLVIWHKDPQTDGTDSSCRHRRNNRRLSPREQELQQAIYDLMHTLGNRPFYGDPRIDSHHEPVYRALHAWEARQGWRLPVRWHVWHWRFQVVPLQGLKRWLCSK